MGLSDATAPGSAFMQQHIPLLLARFAISFCREDLCIEYFITRRTGEPISYALVLSLDIPARSVHVSRFHPELYREQSSRYLSAALFYLMIHHFAQCFGLDDSFTISLETRQGVFSEFYGRLDDFSFRIHSAGVGETVDLRSELLPLQIDTSMITERLFPDGALRFLV
jgi:hypothetical protein